MNWLKQNPQVNCSAAQDKKYGRTRRELLHEEYVEGSKRGGIGQPKDGFEVLSIPELHQKSSGHMLGLVLRRLHISDSTPAPLKYTSGSEQCREHLTMQSGC